MNITTMRDELEKARKSNDHATRDVITNIIATAKRMAIDKGIHNEADITDDIVDAAIVKEMKIVNEQIDTCPDNRTMLMDNYQYTKSILARYMPHIMTTQKEILEYIANSVGVEITKTNRGIIMKALKGKADMKVANEIFKEI